MKHYIIPIVILLYLTLLTNTVSAATSLTELVVHTQISNGQSFEADGYTITLQDIEPKDEDDDTSVETLLMNITRSSTNEQWYETITAGGYFHFGDNDKYTCYYVKPIRNKYMFNVFAQRVPALGISIVNKSIADSDDFKLNITIGNTGISATDVSVKIILPEGYTISNKRIFSNQAIVESDSIYRLVRISCENPEAITNYTASLQISYDYVGEVDENGYLEYYFELPHEVTIPQITPETTVQPVIVQSEVVVPSTTTVMSDTTTESTTVSIKSSTSMPEDVEVVDAVNNNSNVQSNTQAAQESTSSDPYMLVVVIAMFAGLIISRYV